ncbi:hypothetical protein ZHAS_00015239 [Anopheles sinensis]|uniref:Uncharacterized protein n=1 Tax=Anopheles sinensis TaxID=74873 RepID=A0A084WAH1_ANOSI|nr:hypothetical protein ZHAS_00015239 [Anopheles sinensis]
MAGDNRLWKAQPFIPGGFCPWFGAPRMVFPVLLVVVVRSGKKGPIKQWFGNEFFAMHTGSQLTFPTRPENGVPFGCAEPNTGSGSETVCWGVRKMD